MSHHVALFLQDLRGGGAERMFVNLAHGLVARGHRVDVVLAKACGAFLEQLPKEAKVFDLKARDPMLSLPPLLRYLKAERPETLFSALHQPNVVACVAKRLRRKRLRVIIGIRSTLSKEVEDSKSFKQKLTLPVVKLFCKSADKVACVSLGVADDYARLTGTPKNKVAAIYNPVIDEALVRGAKRRPEHPWFAEGEPPVVLGAGRLETWKDFPTLIRAVTQARANIECRLMILGDGPERERLNQIAEQVGLGAEFQTPGFQPDPYGYMGHCGVFVLSSQYEGLPGVLIQAMACGAPVVATDCPSGPYEVLEGGKWGYLTPVGDADAMSAAIVKCLNGEAKPVDSESLKRFTSDAVMAQYERLLFE